jgi:hypothetical protein
MAKAHGNKVHYQVLLDVNRAKLLDEAAEKQGMRSSALLRMWTYQGLQAYVDGATYRLAEAQDAAVRRSGIQNQVNARRLTARNDASTIL